MSADLQTDDLPPENLPPTERFSDRAAAYARHRPGYPPAILDVLQTECGLNPEHRIADVAAGTGLLTQVLLAHGNPVTAVEPNAAMLEFLGTLSARFPQLSIQQGTAEATELPDSSVDFLLAAQAMHWFDLARARREFQRILRPDGWCVVIYNERQRGGDAFHDGYEHLLRQHGVGYEQVQASHLSPEQCAAFFHPCAMKRVVVENAQELDLEGLTGRIVSSSYMPTASAPTYPAIQRAIAQLFEASQSDGHVTLRYACSVSFGKPHCG